MKSFVSTLMQSHTPAPVQRVEPKKPVVKAHFRRDPNEYLELFADGNTTTPQISLELDMSISGAMKYMLRLEAKGLVFRHGFVKDTLNRPAVLWGLKKPKTVAPITTTDRYLLPLKRCDCLTEVVAKAAGVTYPTAHQRLHILLKEGLVTRKPNRMWSIVKNEQ